MSARQKPRYQQLKDLIITQISSGELRPHDRVPSENELVERMNVSRMTANRALRELTDEGYVERVAGRGTFVSDFRSRSPVLEVHNIADEIARRGHRHSCEVLRNSRQHARGEVARALHVEQGVDVFHLILVHYEDGAAIQVEVNDLAPVTAPVRARSTAGRHLLARSALAGLREDLVLAVLVGRVRDVRGVG